MRRQKIVQYMNRSDGYNVYGHTLMFLFFYRKATFVTSDLFKKNLVNEERGF